MNDQRCRVTVVGAHRRIDLAVPAVAPIAEYVNSLADLCGQEDSDVLPAAWSLAAPGRRAMPPTASLVDAGVVDGQILYLRDATDGEYDEPVVMDIEELVAGASDRVGGPRWNNPVRAAAIVVAGVGALVAAPLQSALTDHTSGSTLPGAVAVFTGLFLPFLAWTARRSGWPIGTLPCQLMALAAVPALATAAWVLIRPSLPATTALIAVALAATVGALIALLAAPGVTSLAVQALALIALLVVALLSRLHATGAQSAATIALVGYAMLAAAPWAAGHLISFWPLPSAETADADEQARTDVVRGRLLLTAWTAVSAVVVAVALVVVGREQDLYAAGLVGCLSVALLRRAGGYQLLAEAGPVVLAAAAGLFTVLVHLPRLVSGLPPQFGTVAAGLIGSMTLVLGVALAFRRDTEPLPRQAWLRAVSGMCVIASVPLLLGMYGVFDQLFSIGRHM
jgi:type VII secretion integral membrane protein EccD